MTKATAAAAAAAAAAEKDAVSRLTGPGGLVRRRETELAVAVERVKHAQSWHSIDFVRPWSACASFERASRAPRSNALLQKSW